MKIEKILAALSAITMMTAAATGYPSDTLRKQTVYAADSCAPSVNSEFPDITAVTATSDVTDDGWEYDEFDNYITITGYQGAEASVVIPSEINGKTVTTIQDRFLSDNTTLKEITIPKTITKTGNKNYGPFQDSSVETVIFEEGIAKIPNYICLRSPSVKNVVIPEKADAADGYVIGEYAFFGTSITSIDLPESLTEIGEFAFGECTLLKSIDIPDNVTKIGECAFLECLKLTDVSLGEKTADLGNSCFEECKALEAIDLKNVVTVGTSCFDNCISLSSVDLRNVKTLGGSVFSRTVHIKEITIPRSVTKTGHYSSGCLEGSNIETVIFEEGIANIPDKICLNASSVKEVVIPEKEDNSDGYKIGKNAFMGTSISEVKLPESLTEIGANAFSECTLIKSITIPDNVTVISDSAFQGCEQLADIKLSKSLTSIGSLCFADCTSLTSIDLKNVETIGDQVFSGADKLKEITFPKTVVNAGSQNYGCLEGSSVETVIFEEGIANIPDYVFSNSSRVKNVTIPEKEDNSDGYKIGEKAFMGTSISEVKLPESLTEIGANAFSSCKLIENITIPDNTIALGNSAFQNCEKLADITLGDKTAYIGDYCFADCISLSSVDLKNVEELGCNVFSGVDKLKEITFPKSVKKTGDLTSGCLEGSYVETVIFEEGIANIPNYVCLNSSSVKNVTLPEKADSTNEYWIGNSAFCGTSISEIDLPESLTGIKENAFTDCTLIKSIIIPDNVTIIYEYAFKNCTGLENVTSGKNVALIGNGCFTDCTSLSSIDLKNVETLGSKVFDGAESLKELTIPETVTKAGNSDNGCLEGSSVETLIFADGMDTVPEYIAMNCTSLKNAELADSVTTIGNYAFSNCSELENITSSRSSFTVSSNSF